MFYMLIMFLYNCNRHIPTLYGAKVSIIFENTYN